MLVDDDAGALRGLAMALKMLRHSCETFNDPLDARENFKAGAYDVVITDICMPHISGFELGNQIRQMRPNARIIYMSGQMSANAEEELEKDSQRYFLRKPINFDEIREILNRLGEPARAVDGLFM